LLHFEKETVVGRRGKRWRKEDLERKKRRRIKEEGETQARGRLILKS